MNCFEIITATIDFLLLAVAIVGLRQWGKDIEYKNEKDFVKSLLIYKSWLNSISNGVDASSIGLWNTLVGNKLPSYDEHIKAMKERMDYEYGEILISSFSLRRDKRRSASMLVESLRKHTSIIIKRYEGHLSMIENKDINNFNSMRHGLLESIGEMKKHIDNELEKYP